MELIPNLGELHFFFILQTEKLPNKINTLPGQNSCVQTIYPKRVKDKQ